jgi:hypothetical protein
MRISLATALIFAATNCFAAEKSASHKAIGKAIANLEADRDRMDDAIEVTKTQTAIRELEALIVDADKEDVPATDKVTIAIKKKLAGKECGRKSLAS